MALHDREYVRQRFVFAVDKMLDEMERDDRDISVDTFLVAGIINWYDEKEGGEAEEPFVYSESRRSHVKIGVLRMATLLVEQPLIEIVDGCDGEG